MALDERLLTREEKAILSLRALFEGQGYRRYRMSRFEPYDFYARCRDFLDERILTFTDISGKLMALKPDVTLPILMSAEDGSRLYYNESVYRSVDGAFREMTQAGAEHIGRVGVKETAAMAVLAGRALQTAFPGGVLVLSHQGFLRGAMRALKMPEQLEETALLCIRQKNLDGMLKLCAGAALDEKAADMLRRMAALCAPVGETAKLLRPLVQNRQMEKAVQEMELVSSLAALQTDCAPIMVDLSALNPMRYYDGLTFTGFAEGLPRAVLSGGQYGGLMRRMGRRGSGTGFALYLNELEELP